MQSLGVCVCVGSIAANQSTKIKQIEIDRKTKSDAKTIDSAHASGTKTIAERELCERA